MPQIYLPKEFVAPDPLRPKIFLGGPIRGGGDWQKDMCEILIGMEVDVEIVCPCRWTADHPLAHYFHRPFQDTNAHQVSWERYHMERAALEDRYTGCLLFWLGLESENNPHPGPEPYAMDTRREVGKFTGFIKLRRKLDCGTRMVIGGDEKFYGLRTILDDLADANGENFRFYQSMNDLAATALEVATQTRR